jgi:hypothetical protein
MDNWKLTNLKSKLSKLGITPLGGGKYLDEGTGKVITEQALEALSRAAGRPLPQPEGSAVALTTRKVIATTTKCRTCGYPIGFVKLCYSERWKPVNSDGRAHRCGMATM